MTLAEKIATVSKLDRIDSSIESCIKILEQELKKREVEFPDYCVLYMKLYRSLDTFKDDFNVMKGKK